MEPDPKTMCDNCIHDDVCGMEGHLEPALKFCGDKISTDTLKLFSKTVTCLRLSDLIPFINDTWYTRLVRTGELDNQTVYIRPDKFRVVGIHYCSQEGKICVDVDEV